MKLINISYLLCMIISVICFFLLHSVDAKIVFVHNGSLYVMNDNGRGIRRLTDNQFWESRPRWSPDGTKIAFNRNLDKKDYQKWQMFVMNADGTNQQQLTDSNEGSKNGSPAWSPDGQHLAFSSNRSGRAEIHVMDLQSQKVTQLTGIEKETGSYTPDWSPDGKEIVYGRSVRRGRGLSDKNIWVMAADGTNQKPLLPDPDREEFTIFRSYPHWFPDGQRILFVESRGPEGQRIKRFVIQRRNGGRKEIDMNEKIGGRWVGSGACLMDDGRAILFSAGLLDVPEKDHFHNIYRYEIATGKLRRLTDPKKLPYNESGPDWVAGPLSVSPQEKLPTQWADIKTLYGIETSTENKKDASQ